MGSPIKTSDYETKSGHEPNTKKSPKFPYRILIFYSVLVALTFLSSGVAFNYSFQLPSLDPRIFESLISVIGILLRLAVAGFFTILERLMTRNTIRNLKEELLCFIKCVCFINRGAIHF